MAEKPDFRQRILEAARHNFFTLGYSRVTMDDLANELAMSKKTLYKYFPAKVDLLKAVVFNFLSGIIETQDRILNDPALGFEERVTALLKGLASGLSGISPLMMRDVQKAVPEVWQIIEATRQQRIDMVFGGLLREGQRNGYVRSDLDLSFVVTCMAATIRETLNPNVVSRYPVTLVEAFEMLASVFMGGILTDDGRRKFFNISGFTPR